ncbi:MAG: hypothetical protein WCN92_00905 [Eubacteriales bacterium]
MNSVSENNEFDGMTEDEIKILEFTRGSQERFYDVVDLDDFRDENPDIIYEHLEKQMRLIPFGDYLKRYIFVKAGFEGNFDEIDIKEYQSIIVDSFGENNTPKSFQENSAKLSALAKNWLTQASVKRNVIFLLGFGLNMSVKDVSDFLVKAQRERDFNFKDPFEIICWYCLKKGFKFPKMMQLRNQYDNMNTESSGFVYGDRTITVRDTFRYANDDGTLLRLLSEFKANSESCTFSVTVQQWFDELYLKARQIIAECFNKDEDERNNERVQKYKDETSNSDKLSDEEKQHRLNKVRAEKKVWTSEDVAEGDVEKFLCCGVPVDNNGNLLKFSVSTLVKHFDEKRLSRQHIHDILTKKSAIDRFDLITLNFFIFSQDDTITNNKTRYIRFIDETNRMLSECSMGEIYVANPYECFLLMCILSDCPLASYADVLEKSFEAAE